MTEFHKKLKAIIKEHFPDTETIKYHVMPKLLKKHPWESKHIVFVYRDWFHEDSPWTAHCAFDDRENLGVPGIKTRIDAMIISCPHTT